MNNHSSTMNDWLWLMFSGEPVCYDIPREWLNDHVSPLNTERTIFKPEPIEFEDVPF